jgi:hypothetical protein
VSVPAGDPRHTGAATGRPWRRGYGGVTRLVQAVSARLDELAFNQVTLRTASLTAFTSTTATITLAEQALTGVPMLASYTPANGDTVLVLQTRGQLVILGRAK